MARTEFHDPDWTDEDSDFFRTRKVGQTVSRPIFMLTVPRGEGIVKITSAHSINELSLDAARELVESLGDAIEFLETHPNHTNDFRS